MDDAHVETRRTGSGGIDHISLASEYLLRFEYGFVTITNLECFFCKHAEKHLLVRLTHHN